MRVVVVVVEGGELFFPKYETPYMPYMPQISSAIDQILFTVVSMHF